MINGVVSLGRRRYCFGSRLYRRRQVRRTSEGRVFCALRSISYHKTVQILSPEGTVAGSLGRKPQVRRTRTITSPEGATQRDTCGHLLPLRASRSHSLTGTWDLRPRLPTVAASRLPTITVRLTGWARENLATKTLFAAKGCLLAFLMMSVTCRAEDTVVIKTGTDGQGQRKLSGTIIDFDAHSLTFRSSSGRENEIPANSIIRFETTWPADKVDADRLQSERKVEEALPKLRLAVGQESRPWAKRLLQADIVWCLRSLDRPGEACNEYFRLLATDPTKQYFAAIPLAWSTPRPSPTLERRARSWLEHEQPVVRLLGASWLLSIDRGQAVSILERLTSDPDTLIAKMAEAQLWGTKLTTASDAEIDQWTKLVADLPEVLRGGPYFALGRVLAYRKQHEQAALAFMRVPTLYPRDNQLVVEALLAAAGELEKLGRSDEAAGLYRELVNDHQDTPQAAQATGRLKAISDDTTDE